MWSVFEYLKSAPIFCVLKEPISVFNLTLGPIFSLVVIILITPPIASLPHNIDWEPFRISILSILELNKLEKSYRPSGVDGSETETPSIKTRVWPLAAPLILAVAVPPKAPFWLIYKPGIVWRASFTKLKPLFLIWSEVIISTELPNW